MNRRDFFRMAPPAVAAGVGVVVAAKAVAETPAPEPIHEIWPSSDSPLLKMEKVLELPSNVTAMQAYRDGVLVCTEHDGVYWVTQDECFSWRASK